MTREMVKMKLKSIVTNEKIYIPVDPTEIPKDIFVEGKDSIQVRILHNEDLQFTKRRDKGKGMLASCICGSTNTKEV